MKILLVNKFYWAKGGSERVLFDLEQGYRQAGHEAIVFAMHSELNRPSPEAESFAPEMRWSGGPWRKLQAAGRAIYSREAKSRIRALVRRTKPDVAHLHNFHHQLSPSIVDGLREEGVPCIHTLHDYKVVCPNYLLYTQGAVCERCRGGHFHQAILHRCVRESVAASTVACVEMTLHRRRRTLERGIQRFVSPSRFLSGKLVEFGFDPASIRVVPNGIDPASFEPAVVPGTAFLYAGRLSREKGLRTLIEAVARIPDAQLNIAGDGPEESSTREFAQTRAPGRVIFRGRLDRSEVLDLVRAARAVVLPSEWYENAPISALEALASGVPVIGSNLGGIPEIVRHEQTGLVFAPGDDAALAQAMTRLSGDDALATRLGRRGREVVENEYRLDQQVSRMLEILSEVRTCASR